MDRDFVIFISIMGVLLVAALIVEGLETIQKWIGLKQEQLKAPPEPRQQPVIVLQREEESPRVLQPHEVSNGTPALTPRRGGGDSQSRP
jgi:hypothetical protein